MRRFTVGCFVAVAFWAVALGAGRARAECPAHGGPHGGPHARRPVAAAARWVGRLIHVALWRPARCHRAR